MNRYVKVKDTHYNITYKEWCRVVDPNEGVEKSFNKQMQDRLFDTHVKNGIHSAMSRSDLKEGLSYVEWDNRNWADGAKVLGAKTTDYNKLSERFGTLLVRESGSFMTMTSHTDVLEDVISNHYPIDKANIVICENDHKAEYNWTKYLSVRFNSEPITVANYFFQRSNEELQAYFKQATYITFSTTFSDLTWWENLCINLQPHNKVIGYCHIKENWKKALALCKPDNLEKVYKID